MKKRQKLGERKEEIGKRGGLRSLDAALLQPNAPQAVGVKPASGLWLAFSDDSERFFVNVFSGSQGDNLDIFLF